MANIPKLLSKLDNKYEYNDKKKNISIKFSKYILEEIKNSNFTESYAIKLLISVNKYLVYCNNFNKKLPSRDSLEGYLWLHYNEKYYLNKFIKFYYESFKINIDNSNIIAPVFIRPKRSHQILKERVIYILNNPDDKHLTQKYIMDALIGYFHWIYIPRNVFLKISDIKNKNNQSFIRINKHIFYLLSLLSFTNIKKEK